MVMRAGNTLPLDFMERTNGSRGVGQSAYYHKRKQLLRYNFGVQQIITERRLSAPNEVTEK